MDLKDSEERSDRERGGGSESVQEKTKEIPLEGDAPFVGAPCCYIYLSSGREADCTGVLSDSAARERVSETRGKSTDNRLTHPQKMRHAEKVSTTDGMRTSFMIIPQK